MVSSHVLIKIVVAEIIEFQIDTRHTITDHFNGCSLSLCRFKINTGTEVIRTIGVNFIDNTLLTKYKKVLFPIYLRGPELPSPLAIIDMEKIKMIGTIPMYEPIGSIITFEDGTIFRSNIKDKIIIKDKMGETLDGLPLFINGHRLDFSMLPFEFTKEHRVM